MKKGKDGFYCRYIKRLLDILCAMAAITVFCWLYVIVAIIVRIKLGSPVIFKQKRPGKDEKIFELYKFRTMTYKRNDDGNLLPDDVRLTKFGKFLRSTSLDELPEAVNILKGDMSVVGPRPLLVEYLPLYNEHQKKRHKVKPGLSGWAQINGRNTVTWEEKFDLDVEYVDTVCFRRDFMVVIMTIGLALKRKGISAEGEATVGAFEGSKTK